MIMAADRGPAGGQNQIKGTVLFGPGRLKPVGPCAGLVSDNTKINRLAAAKADRMSQARAV